MDKEIPYIKFLLIDNNVKNSTIIEVLESYDFKPTIMGGVSFYYPNNDFQKLLVKWEEGRLLNHDGNKINYTQLEEYFTLYGKAFNQGYNDYLSNTLDDILIDENNTILKERIFNKANPPQDIPLRPSMPFLIDENENYQLIFDDIYHYGIIAGEHYRSWVFITQYHKLFEALFNDNFNEDYESINESSYDKNNQAVNWKGTQTDLIELIKALIENGTVKGKQKDIINSISTFFGIEINHPDKLINDIKNRNNGSETLFLDSLKMSLFDYLKK